MKMLNVNHIALLRFPRDDAEFERVVEGIAADLGDLARVGPEVLEERLRRTYPNAVVHEQEPMAGLNPNGPAWYVYRDGSPIAR